MILQTNEAAFSHTQRDLLRCEIQFNTIAGYAIGVIQFLGTVFALTALKLSIAPSLLIGVVAGGLALAAIITLSPFSSLVAQRKAAERRPPEQQGPEHVPEQQARPETLSLASQGFLSKARALRHKAERGQL